MALVKCPRCSKLFDKIRSPVCTRCMDDEERDYDKVREVLNAQPDLDAEQVSGETEVPIDCIMRMIEEGLLANAALLEGKVKCGMCGAPAISASKRLCQACLEKLNARVTQAQAQIKMEEKKDIQVGDYLGGIRQSFENKRPG